MGEMCEAGALLAFVSLKAEWIIISKLCFDLLDFSAAEKECRVSKTGIVASESARVLKGQYVGRPYPAYTLKLELDSYHESKVVILHKM